MIFHEMAPSQDSPFRMFAEFDGDINKIFGAGKEGDMPVLITRNMVNFPGVLGTVLYVELEVGILYLPVDKLQ